VVGSFAERFFSEHLLLFDCAGCYEEGVFCSECQLHDGGQAGTRNLLMQSPVTVLCFGLFVRVGENSIVFHASTVFLLKIFFLGSRL